jgi:hypothetical protein
MDTRTTPPHVSTPHLSDAELFGLALPPAGMPEALPSHLSDCLACARALSEWKAAVRELCDDAASLDRRSPEDWSLAEERTLQAIRRSRAGGGRMHWGWTAGIAASLLLVALVIPLRDALRSGASRSAPLPSVTAAGTAPSGVAALSAQDQADDALLRDVARMSRAEDSGGSWSTLAPEPGSGDRGQAQGEDHL